MEVFWVEIWTYSTVTRKSTLVAIQNCDSLEHAKEVEKMFTGTSTLVPMIEAAGTGEWI